MIKRVLFESSQWEIKIKLQPERAPPGIALNGEINVSASILCALQVYCHVRFHCYLPSPDLIFSEFFLPDRRFGHFACAAFSADVDHGLEFSVKVKRKKK